MKGLDKYLEPEPDPILFEELEELVIKWGKERGLLETDDGQKQLLKFFEESGELARAELKQDRPEQIDALGDILVTLILYSKINDLNLTECLESAYHIIKHRTGNTVNGTFIKDE